MDRIIADESISIVREGVVCKYEGDWTDINLLIQQMQRAANPLINLTSKDQIIRFLNTSKKRLLEEDYTEGIINKQKNFEISRDPDNYLKELGFNTRLVVFVYDKSDYVEELQELKKLAVK